MTLKIFIRSIILVLILVALGFLLKTSEFGEIIDKNWIDNYVGGNGLEGKFIFVLVASLLVTIGFPRQVISLNKEPESSLLLPIGLNVPPIVAEEF